ncbi:MAG: hypothetical protein QOG37_20 [Mycobacterium sp.]|jgi:hypothetical protein|nr:hypothetical protein [Mycobacterium sp.]
MAPEVSNVTIEAGGPALPETLYGQLFLLAFDPRRNRFHGKKRWRFGLALRTAILTDLYLAGHLDSIDGRPTPTLVPHPADPVLLAALSQTVARAPELWREAVAHRSTEKTTPRVLRQMRDSGWVTVQRRRTFGVLPAERLSPACVEPVDALGNGSIALSPTRSTVALRTNDCSPWD